MNNPSASATKSPSGWGVISNWLFGMAVIVISIINRFWENDPGYGIFILVLSLVYVPPAIAFLKKLSGLSIPLAVKIILGLFILWSVLGIGELWDKINLMLQDL